MSAVDELFEVPESWWRRRRCQVCGGPLSVTHAQTYVVQRQGWVKIGASSNIPERLGVLRRSGAGCLVRMPEGMDLAEPLLLVCVLDEDREHQLHREFRDAHVVGEWFLPDAALREWLAVVSSGDGESTHTAEDPQAEVRPPRVSAVSGGHGEAGQERQGPCDSAVPEGPDLEVHQVEDPRGGQPSPPAP